MTNNKYIVDIDSEGERVDSFLSDNIPDWSRNYIQNLIDDGYVLLNGKQARSGKKLKLGDELAVVLRDNVCLDVVAENIPIDIVYQDEWLAVINKQRGLVVHPAPNLYSGTLVNALLYHLDNLSGINGVIRPGIVHRIDKDTTGLLVVAKNDIAHNRLSEQIQCKQCKRIYFALVDGVIPEDEGVINLPIGRSHNDRKKMAVVADGKPAITHYKVIERFSNNTLVECSLETGRTHQIRVHLREKGFPVVGDPVYGIKKQKFVLDGQLLHAYKLIFNHPHTNELMEFCAQLPMDFDRILNILRNKKNN